MAIIPWKTIGNQCLLIYNVGHGCPHCSGNVKSTLECVRKFLLGKEIKLLSTEYKNASQKLEVECMKCGWNSCDNNWRPTFKNIKNHNRGCSRCNGGVSFTYDFIKQDLMKNNNISLLNKEYINTRNNYVVKCNNCKYVWETTISSMRQGSGCPICNVPGKSQKLLFSILKNIFLNCDCFYNYKGFEWLKNKKKMELDVFIKDSQSDFSLGIEYDGIQHYSSRPFFSDEKKLNERKKLDKLKNKLVCHHPSEIKYFIRIPYWEKITEKNIKKILKENGICLKE